MKGSFVKKLKIKQTDSLMVYNAPAIYLEAIRNEAGLPEPATKPGNKKYSYILLFVTKQKELDEYFPAMLQKYAGDCNFWIAYPKKSSTIESNLGRNEAWNILKTYKYRPVTQIAIDDQYSAIRVKPGDQVAARTKPDIPEIDYKKRIVFPPDDLKKSLKENNLLEAFEKMSFTHKKEHVESIVEAKKPETRERRIRKAIEMINVKK